MCRKFEQTGTCPYGSRCRFIHKGEPFGGPSGNSSRSDLIEAAYFGASDGMLGSGPIPTLPGLVVSVTPMTASPSNSRHASLDEPLDPVMRLPLFKQLAAKEGGGQSLFRAALQPGAGHALAAQATAQAAAQAARLSRRSSYEVGQQQPPYLSARDSRRAASIDSCATGILPTAGAEAALQAASHRSAYGVAGLTDRSHSVPPFQQPSDDWQPIAGGFQHPFASSGAGASGATPPGSLTQLLPPGVQLTDLSPEQLQQLRAAAAQQRRWTASDSPAESLQQQQHALQQQQQLQRASVEFQQALLLQEILRQRERVDFMLASGGPGGPAGVGGAAGVPQGLPVAAPLQPVAVPSAAAASPVSTDALVDQLVAQRVRELQRERLQFMEHLAGLQGKLQTLQLQQQQQAQQTQAQQQSGGWQELPTGAGAEQWQGA